MVDDGDDGDDYGWGAVTDLRQLNLNDDLKPWIPGRYDLASNGMVWCTSDGVFCGVCI